MLGLLIAVPLVLMPPILAAYVPDGFGWMAGLGGYAAEIGFIFGIRRFARARRRERYPSELPEQAPTLFPATVLAGATLFAFGFCMSMAVMFWRNGELKYSAALTVITIIICARLGVEVTQYISQPPETPTTAGPGVEGKAREL
jgi:hypothetical protein